MVTDQDRQFWSFQPFQKNAAPLASDRWVQSPIDGFFFEKSAKKIKDLHRRLPNAFGSDVLRSI
jgi:hypothetical protein